MFAAPDRVTVSPVEGRRAAPMAAWVPLLIGSGSERYMMIPTFAPKERGSNNSITFRHQGAGMTLFERRPLWPAAS